MPSPTAAPNARPLAAAYSPLKDIFKTKAEVGPATGMDPENVQWEDIR